MAMSFKTHSSPPFGYEDFNRSGYETSSFNDAVRQINRLDYAWVSIARSREKGRLNDARWKLDTAEIELRYDAEKLDDERKTNYIEQLDDINNSFKSADRRIGKIRMRIGEEDEDMVHKINNYLYYDLLMKKELILRKIQQEAGKGGKYKSGDDDMMMD
jgi:hypothetical protein